MNPSRFPDPADTAPAGADAPRTFASICDVCLRPAAGDVLREGEDVYLRRRCAEHGERRLLMSRNGDRFVRLDRAYHRLFPPDVPPQPTIDTCYFITNRCNQACSYCATEAGRYPYFGDMDAGGFRDALAGHRGSKVSLIGGEPLVHPRFFDFAEAVGRSGKTLVIYTNGLGLGDDAMLGRLAAAAPKLEIRMTFEGFPEEAYGHLEGRSLRARKIGALRNLERRGVSTVLGHTLLAGEDTDASRRALRSIVEFAMTRDFVRGLTFQSAVALGGSRHLAADDMLSVDGVIDRVVDALPVPVPREVAYPTQKLLLMMARLFGLPMCSYVQTVPLFRTRRGWVSLDHFFDLDRLDARLDANNPVINITRGARRGGAIERVPEERTRGSGG